MLRRAIERRRAPASKRTELICRAWLLRLLGLAQDEVEQLLGRHALGGIFASPRRSQTGFAPTSSNILSSAGE